MPMLPAPVMITPTSPPKDLDLAQEAAEAVLSTLADRREFMLDPPDTSSYGSERHCFLPPRTLLIITDRGSREGRGGLCWPC